MYNFGVFFRKVSICFLFCSLLMPAVFSLAPSAECAILIDADSGKCIYAKNADKKHGMASTTKIMTAILAIENGVLDAEFPIPSAAVGIEGSSLYLQEGERMSLRDLLYGLMLRSANDAATAIAINISGSTEVFADLMNQKAKELGLSNTHFTNPHGLADDAHYTTARDLALLSAYALKNETFREICQTKKASLPGNRLVVNHNKLLFTYTGACGVKTGFTKATGRCLVSAAEQDGVRLIAVTLHASNDWNDHAAMLDHGFAEYESVTLAQKGAVLCPVSLMGGTVDTVEAVIGETLTVSLPKNRGSIVERVELPQPRFAPIYAGDLLGRVVYLVDGTEIATAPLYAKDYVLPLQKESTWLDKIKNIFK